MTSAALLALLLLSGPCSAQDDSSGEASVVSEDITIRGKPLAGPPIAVPPVGAEKPLIDEVIRSLGVYNADFKAGPSKTKVPAASKRLSRPFPEPPFLTFSPASFTAPYRHWRFEVFSPEAVVWHTEGDGTLRERLAWDGTDGGSRFVARVGVPYAYRFTGVQDGDDELTVASETVELASMQYRQDLGGMRLEVENSVLFEAGKSSFRDLGVPYLQEITLRLRRLNPRGKPYHLVLYQENAGSPLAGARAAALRHYVSNELLINPNRVVVDLLGVINRGDVTACDLPGEESRLDPR